MAKHAFEKFMGNEPKGAKKKEAIKVGKRNAKKEARAVGEQKRREKWEKQHGVAPQDANKATSSSTSSRTGRPVTPRSANGKSDATKPSVPRPVAPRVAKSVGDKTTKKTEPEARENKPRFGKRPFIRTPKTGDSEFEDDDSASENNDKADKPSTKKFSKKYVTSNSDKYFKGELNAAKDTAIGEGDAMPLNKYVAHAGVCGRREAATMVKEGSVTVNGDVVYEPGYKVLPTDEVLLKGKKLHLKKNLVYILLNKPKDYLTTSSDPSGRKTVLDLVKEATKERVYPVGRLDRNTTGVLLLTNDGDLAQKLTHPGYQIKKVYAVKLDKPVTKKDFETILSGVTLEDGVIQADSLGYTDAKDKAQVGIQIHSGRNRIVRRIFESLGYEVKTLDRVMFANLTKKNVERGTWRFLNEKEVRLLKYMNQSFVKKDASEVEADTEE